MPSAEQLLHLVSLNDARKILFFRRVPRKTFYNCHSVKTAVKFERMRSHFAKYLLKQYGWDALRQLYKVLE